MIPSIQRKCGTCGKVKPLTDFSLHNQKMYGRSHTCYDCENKRGRERYKRRKNHTLARQKEYYQMRKVRDKDKVKARDSLKNAVRDGRIVRKPCKVCGDIKSEGHHTDYSKPLKVEWLCIKHHRLEHRKPLTLLDNL